MPMFFYCFFKGLPASSFTVWMIALVFPISFMSNANTDSYNLLFHNVLI